MYICTLSVCLKQAYTLTHTCVRSTGGAYNSQDWRTVGPRLKIQQELTQQLSCLWFQKSVHLQSKLKVLSAHIFFKNKIHLQKWSFSSIPLLAVKKIHSHKLFWYFCHSSSQLRLFIIFFSEGKHQAYPESNCTLKPEYCHSTIYMAYYIAHVVYRFGMDWWHYVRLRVEELKQYKLSSFQQYHQYLAHQTLLQASLFLMSLMPKINSNYLVFVF